jgi:hypothetical protein
MALCATDITLSSFWLGALYVLKSRTFPRMAKMHADSKSSKPSKVVIFGTCAYSTSMNCCQLYPLEKKHQVYLFVETDLQPDLCDKEEPIFAEVTVKEDE